MKHKSYTRSYRRSVIRLGAIVALAFAVGLFALTPDMQVAAQPGKPAANNINYANTQDKQQTLDVYQPTATGGQAAPVIMLIHGGGFTAGDKTDVRPLALALTRQGYAVVSVNYRLSPANVFPAHVQDVFCAWSWVHANAEKYSFDMARAYVWGGSAGATLTLMISSVDDPAPYMEKCPNTLPEKAAYMPKAVVAYYPGTDFVNLSRDNTKLLVGYLGGSRADKPDVWAEASPITHVNGDEPPTLLIHGTADTTAPYAHSQAMEKALKDAKASVQLFTLQGAEHGFMVRINTPEGKSALEAAIKYLKAR